SRAAIGNAGEVFGSNTFASALIGLPPRRQQGSPPGELFALLFVACGAHPEYASGSCCHTPCMPQPPCSAPPSSSPTTLRSTHPHSSPQKCHRSHSTAPCPRSVPGQFLSPRGATFVDRHPTRDCAIHDNSRDR